MKIKNTSLFYIYSMSAATAGCSGSSLTPFFGAFFYNQPDVDVIPGPFTLTCFFTGGSDFFNLSRPVCSTCVQKPGLFSRLRH